MRGTERAAPDLFVVHRVVDGVVAFGERCPMQRRRRATAGRQKTEDRRKTEKPYGMTIADQCVPFGEQGCDVCVVRGLAEEAPSVIQCSQARQETTPRRVIAEVVVLLRGARCFALHLAQRAAVSPCEVRCQHGGRPFAPLTRANSSGVPPCPTRGRAGLVLEGDRYSALQSSWPIRSPRYQISVRTVESRSFTSWETWRAEGEYKSARREDSDGCGLDCLVRFRRARFGDAPHACRVRREWCGPNTRAADTRDDSRGASTNARCATGRRRASSNCRKSRP